MAYGRLGNREFLSLCLCAAAIPACGGEVRSDEATASVGGFTATPGVSSSGGSASVGGATNTIPVIGPDTQFVPLSSTQLDQLQSRACAGWSSEPEVIPVAVEVVVDLSASMLRVDASSGRSDWEVTQSALTSMLATPPVSVWYLGISFFSSPVGETSDGGASSSPCIEWSHDGPLAQWSMAGASISNAIASATPRADAGAAIHDAYAAAVSRLVSNVSSVPGKPLIVLVTDGLPTLSLGCAGMNSASTPVDPNPLVDAIAAAKDAGVATVVVGAPGSAATTGGFDRRTWLSRAARAANTAPCDCSDNGPNYCHIDMAQTADYATALDLALRRFQRPSLPCTFALPVSPMGQTLDYTRTSVVYRSKTEIALIQQNDSSDCQYGWHFVEPSKTIEICAATCSVIECDPYEDISLYFACIDSPSLVQ